MTQTKSNILLFPIKLKFPEPVFSQSDLDLFETYVSDIIQYAPPELYQGVFTIIIDSDPLYT